MKMFAALPIVFLSVPALADDQKMMDVLFSQQRESHQEQMDESEAKYLARGRDYVDAMYQSGGEGDDPYADEGTWADEPLSADQLENPFPEAPVASAEGGENSVPQPEAPAKEESKEAETQAGQ
jgi:hypothetical protein